MYPEIVTLTHLQPNEKEESAISESLEIPQEIEDKSLSKVQLSSNLPALGLESGNISRIEGEEEGNFLGEEFKQKAVSMC